MRRRLFRTFGRAAGVGAVVSGVTGVVANGLLILYFALARPWGSSSSGPWEWMGPANDIVGSVSMATLIPAVVYLGTRLSADRLLVALSAGTVLGAGALAAAGPLLVVGRITLETQFVASGLALPVIFGWLWRASRSGARAGMFPADLGRFGARVGAGALLGTAVVAVALLLPSGTAAQYVTFGLAAVPGLPAYLAFPFWVLRVGTRLVRSAAAGRSAPIPLAGR